MLSPTHSPVIALLTVRADLLLLLLTLLGTQLPELGRAHVVAASVPVLRARGRSLESFFAEHRPRLVLYDITSPYRANWAALQRVLVRGGLSSSRLLLLTGNRQALATAVQTPPVLELNGEDDAALLAPALRQALDVARPLEHP